MPIDAVDVRRALSVGDFTPFFQPLVVLQTGQLAGFEVLARWIHPQKGVIPPNDFIPSAERDGWIGQMMEGLMRKAFLAAAELPEHLTLAVNISPVQLTDRTLPRQIAAVADETGFSMNRLVIEITESGLMHNLDSARKIADELKAMGCKIALDDFGTGYSSLLHLQSLPFDDLKVDQGFVSEMTESRESRKIVASVVGLGQSLSLTTVAEGVETREQAEMLLWMGCEIGQGWLFGRPSPASELRAMVEAKREKVSLGLSKILKGVSTRNFDGLPAQRLAQLQAVYDGAPVGLAFLDKDLKYVSLNRRLAVMNGVSVEEHLGRTVGEVVPAASHQVEPYIRRVLAGQGANGVEVTTLAEGVDAEKILLLSYEPATDEAGEIIGVSVAVVDVTEKKGAAQALRESEDHYRHMVELNPQTPWIMDPEGRTLEVSPAWESTTGLTKEAARDHGWLAALHPDDVAPTESTIAAFIAAGQAISVEYRVRQWDGGWRWMRSRGSPRFDAAGKIVCWYGSVEDVDERKQMEGALRESEAKLKVALAGSGD